MIALISFEKDLVMSKEEATLLGLKYSDDPSNRYGIRKDDSIKKISSYEYFKDELTPVTEEEKIVYRNQDGKTVESYYVHQRAPKGDWVYVEEKNHLVNLESFAKVCNHRFYIERAIQEESSPTLLQGILDEMESKLTRAQKAVDIFSSNTFNQKVNVHVGGGLITTYNELKLLENACTDLVQAVLNAGWRIIATYIQPDQRRPDYILGRFNPAIDGYDMPQGAKR